MEINPRILALIVLVGILFAIPYAGAYLFPKPKVVEPEKVVIESVKEVFVTPTPDGRVYFADEYQNGTRLLKRPYTFIRYNALYKQDMKVTIMVYNYMFFEKLHLFNPATYKYEEMLPDNPDNKFCLIFAYVVMDNIAGDDTRMWMFQKEFFALYNEKDQLTYRNTVYTYQSRIRELENTVSFDGSVKVQAFKSMRAYTRSKLYNGTAGEYDAEQFYLRGGTSNAIDGFIVYQIPKDTTENDLIVLGNFDSFGWSNWRLKI